MCPYYGTANSAGQIMWYMFRFYSFLYLFVINYSKYSVFLYYSFFYEKIQISEYFVINLTIENKTYRRDTQSEFSGVG